MGIIKKYVQQMDAPDVGFLAGGLLLVAGIGMLKIAAGVIVCGLLLMAVSYLSAIPEKKVDPAKADKNSNAMVKL